MLEHVLRKLCKSAAVGNGTVKLLWPLCRPVLARIPLDAPFRWVSFVLSKDGSWQFVGGVGIRGVMWVVNLDPRDPGNDQFDASAQLEVARVFEGAQYQVELKLLGAPPPAGPVPVMEVGHPQYAVECGVWVGLLAFAVACVSAGRAGAHQIVQDIHALQGNVSGFRPVMLYLGKMQCVAAYNAACSICAGACHGTELHSWIVSNVWQPLVTANDVSVSAE